MVDINCRASAEEQMHDFAQSERAEDCETVSHEEICDLLSDPKILWEAIGPDSVDLPFPSPRGGGLFEKSQNAEKMKAVEKRLQIAIANQDINDFGRLIYDQVVNYAKQLVLIRR